MKIRNVLSKFFKALYQSLKRFPPAILLCTAATLLLIVLTHNKNSFTSETREILSRIIMVLALGVPIALCIKLLFERKENARPIVKIAVYLAEAVFLVSYYFLLLTNLKMVPVTRYIAFSLTLYLAFMFIPYFYRRSGFELYIIKLFTRFLISVLYSVVLYLGLAAILFTIDKLLGITIREKVYFDIWLAVIGIFAPCFFLAGVPEHSAQFEVSGYPWLFKILLLYIVMPLLSVYTAILYLYFAKIIITVQWPVGLVAHLVLWYSVITAIVMFFISPLGDINKWAKIFSFWLSKIILPLLLMMFVSIGIRIKAYGVTENRYFVIALGLWALGMMCYTAFTKNRRNILLPVSLALIAVLSVTGPWSSYSLSKSSQLKRFENLLSKYHMISDGKIIKPGVEVTEGDKNEISQILEYFSNSHQFSDIKYLPKDFKTEDMKNIFGFPYTGIPYNNPGSSYFNYSSMVPGTPVDIQGYSYLLDLKGYSPTHTRIDNGTELKYDNQTLEIKILSAGKEIYKKSLEEYGRQLYTKYGTLEKYALSPAEMTFTDETERIKVKYILQNVHGNKGSSADQPKIEAVDFYLLVHVK